MSSIQEETFQTRIIMSALKDLGYPQQPAGLPDRQEDGRRQQDHPHRQGAYAALIADVIARNKAGKPVLCCTWTPYWGGVLVPGKDVVWLEVPRSSLPGSSAGKSTKLPKGKDRGFEVNSQHVVASKTFTDANPSAAKVFELAKLDVNDVNAQNTRMNDGEKDSAAIDRHVAGWVKANQKTYDGWLEQARAAKK